MASITKRASGRWQAKVRRFGSPPISRTFADRAAAVRWAREMEVQVDLTGALPKHDLRRVTLGDLLRRFLEEACPARRGGSYEAAEIAAYLQHPIARYALASLAREHFASLRDELTSRLNQKGEPLSPDTVIRKLTVLRSVIAKARNDWGYEAWPSPMAGLKMPRPREHRTRRYAPAELRRLVAAWRIARKKREVVGGRAAWTPLPPKVRSGCRNRYVPLAIRVALETGMRRAELLSVRVVDLRLDEQTLLLRRSATKSGRERWVPLTQRAVNLIQRALRQPNRKADEEHVFPLTVNAYKLAWQRIRERAGLADADLRMHDMRGETISRGIEDGLSLPEVAVLSGHEDYRALKRYVRVSAKHVAQRLNRIRLQPMATGQQ